MAGGERDGFSVFSLLLRLLLILLFFPAIRAENLTFTPPDLYLLDCGSPKSLQLPDGRTFRSEPQSSSFLSTDEDIRLSSSSSVSFPFSALYLTARVFSGASTYSFFISKLGLHFLRLHFFPFPSPSYNLSSAVFTVSTQDFVLLRDFSLPASPLIKEYLIDAKTERLCIIFKPRRGSFAFINALEVVSAPDSLIPIAAAALSPQEPFSGINNYALELVSRINVGGGQISPENDPLARSWLPDSFLTPPQAAKSVAVPPEKVRYPVDGFVTPLVAPRSVYATADTMASSNASQPMFNVTWQIPVIADYSYLIRLHFCDIVSRSPNSLYFNVFINGILAIPNLDLSSLTGGNLAMAYCKDFVVQGSAVISGTISVQISPPVMNDPGLPNAILNGIEVMKMSNRAGSLDGPYSVDGSYQGASERRVILHVVVLFLGAVGLAFVVFLFIRWQRTRKARSLTSWLSPLTACTKGWPEFTGRWSGKGSSLYGSSKNGAWKKGLGSQHKSKSGYTSFLASGGLGLRRWFSFAELQQATGNFSEKNVIGVGGFGKVYSGELQDETGTTKVAVKRGNPSSEQGVNEFQTEIEMLSKLRHRHLVSLIGCCDENKEMILVYEFMSKGPLRDHLYRQGANYSSPPSTLSWKQRLEVCIGAARGLHYLHTGASQGIIHRDVKSTNILLDDKLVAKMADFGLSKAGPSSLDQTHVSTAVKGSFGYLDPEYFRRQQLTDKSDVYSFGVVMLEVLCARPAINPALPRDQVNLAEWAMHWHRKGHIDKIVDPLLAGVVAPASLKKFVEAAEKCLADSGVDRPPMGDVLWNLEYSLQLQEAWIDEAKEEGEDGPSDTGNAGGEIDLQQHGEPQKERQFEDEFSSGNSRDSSFAAGPALLFHGR